MVKMSQDPSIYINFGPWPVVSPDQYQPAVAELYRIVNSTPGMADDLAKAIYNAYNATTPPILEVSNIQSVTDFYNFLQALVTWVPFEENTGTLVYNMLCLTYFIIDQDPITNYQSPLQVNATPPDLTPLSKWLVHLANNMGDFLSTPASLTDATLQTFYTAQNYNIDAYQVPQGGWLTFNDFFARKFLSGLRPIDQPDNTLVIVSAADSTFDGPTSNPPDPYDTTSWWPIEANGTVTFTLDAKGISWPISQLLNGSKHAATFNGGVFTHAFLGPADYHRQHSPITGLVIEQTIIQEQCYLQVIIVPTTDQKGNLVHRLKPGRPINRGPKFQGPRHLLDGSPHARQDAPDSPGYQFCQTRGLFIIDSGDPKIGLVAVLPIGMCQVSSVVPSNDPQPFVPYKVTKGQEISYFQFGGSDIVLCFQSQANVEILADKGKHYSVGQQIGLFNSNTPSNPPKKI